MEDGSRICREVGVSVSMMGRTTCGSAECPQKIAELYEVFAKNHGTQKSNFVSNY
jgi:hypothetical protein